MRTSDFDYTLPKRCIAQEPLEVRDRSRLLCLNRGDNIVDHTFFYKIKNHLRKGDRLVFNNTKVLPARFECIDERGKRFLFLFVKKLENGAFEILAKSAGKFKKDAFVSLVRSPDVVFQVVRDGAWGAVVVKIVGGPFSDIEPLLMAYGSMPLPPYIKRSANPMDAVRYQTVYANRYGAIAAPTAGLHFTADLLEALQREGIDFSGITLHIGIGTFKPVKEENVLDHRMHGEEYQITDTTAAEIRQTKKDGGRIIAVGTTSVRVLEHCAGRDGSVQSSKGVTELLIVPGFEFRIVDGLITNFHLPKSTLLMLVSAFAGRERILSLYNEAVASGYRFYSYGDAMFLY